jgi:putative flippase GtrA
VGPVLLAQVTLANTILAEVGLTSEFLWNLVKWVFREENHFKFTNYFSVGLKIVKQ